MDTTCNISKFTANTTGDVDYTTVGSVIRTAVVLLVSITIIVSNLLNFVILKTAKQMSGVTKVFLTNVTAADFCSGLIACLPSVGPAITGTWPYGVTWCHISGIFHRSCSAVSVWTVGFIGLERYIATRHPLFYKQKLTPRKSFGIVCLLWALNIIMSQIPNITKYQYLYRLNEFLPDIGMCGLHCESPVLCITKVIVFPALNGLVIICTTTSIVRALRQEKSPQTRAGVPTVMAPSRNQHTSGKCKMKAVRLLIVTTSLYFLTWGPYSTSEFLKVYGLHSPDWLAFALMWTANSNCFVNVFIYSAIYPWFRTRLKNLLSVVIRCRPSFPASRVEPWTTSGTQGSKRH